MNSCPNKSLPEWKALENAVGNVEAYRDYLEQNGKIRSPKTVQAKIDRRFGIRPDVRELFENNPDKANIFYKDYIIEDLTEVDRLNTMRDYSDYLDESFWQEHPEFGTALDIKAFKDFKQRIIKVNNSIDISINDVFKENHENKSSLDIDYKQMDNAVAIEFADKLSQILGVDYEIINENQALALTEHTENPWLNEPAFFINGKVYFIQSRLSVDTAFHEFSHPFLRAINKENPTLFSFLFSSLSNTEEGQTLISQVHKTYKDLDTDSDMFKEEVLVRALEKENIESIAKHHPTSKFGKFIKDILFAIKQFLRKHFGKDIKIANLNVNTTLKDLSTILQTGNKIKLDADLISEGDIVAYNKEIYDTVLADVKNVRKETIEQTINDMHTIVSKQIRTLSDETTSVEDFAKLYLNKYNTGQLQKINQSLRSLQTTIKQDPNRIIDDLEDTRKKAVALTTTLVELEKVIAKAKDYIIDVSKKPNTRDILQQVHYYNEFIEYWSKFTNEFDKALTDNNISGRHPIKSLVNTLKDDFAISKKHINKMFADGGRDSLYDTLLPMHEYIHNKYLGPNGLITKLQNAPIKELDRIYKEYYGMPKAEYSRYKELLKKSSFSKDEEVELDLLDRKSFKGLEITKEKIERLLTTDISKANYYNSSLEGYLYNTDPVIGGLALFIKNALSDVMIEAQRKYTIFTNDVLEDIKTLGYTSQNMDTLGDKVLFKDTVLVRNPETNKLERKEVFTFLHEFQNYRADYDELKNAEIEAYDEWYRTSSSESYKTYVIAKTKFDKLKRDYFHQDKVDAYYEHQELFKKDTVGVQALFKRDGVLDEINMLKSQIAFEDSTELKEELKLKQREYRQLSSLLGLNGKLKSDKTDADGGSPLKIAQRLKDYNEGSKQFYQFELIPNMIEESFFNFIEGLRTEPNMIEDSEEWNLRVHSWTMDNFIKSPTQNYYDKKKSITDKINQILTKIPAESRKELEKKDLWDEIFDITKGFKDDHNEIIGTELTIDAIAKIKLIQEKLDKLKDSEADVTGLNKEERNLFYYLKSKEREDRLTIFEKKQLTQLSEKKNQGITQLDKAVLSNLFAQLADLSESVPTIYYLDTVNEFLNNIEQAILDELKQKTNVTKFNNHNADKLLDPIIINILSKSNPEFKIWFDNNHIAKMKVDDEGNVYTEYKRLHIWSNTVPVNEAHYEHYTIKDPITDIEHVFQGKPSQDYYTPVLKDEYKTKRVIGVTIDNLGNFLPKNKDLMSRNTELSEEDKYKYINTRYEDILKNDQPLAKVVRKLTKHHLANQENLAKSAKLYMDYPRFGKNELEKLRYTVKTKGQNELNALSFWAKSIKHFIKGDGDKYELGTANYHAQQQNLMRVDIFDNEITDIPIAGLYNIDSEQVSMDVTRSMLRYMFSAERQKQLIKMSPIVRAIQETVNNTSKSADIIKNVHKQNLKNRFLVRLSTKGDDVRKKAVNNLIEREFEGKLNTGIGADTVWAHNFTKLLFKRASFSFFALNIPSALKNSYGMKFQAMMEAAGGTYLDLTSLHKGNMFAYKAMSDMTTHIYNKGPKPYLLQLVDGFDMLQGKVEEKFGEGMSRSLSSDVANLSWLYSFRKFVESQAGLQLAGGVLYKEKVDQTIDGVTQTLNYLDAFEIVNDKLELKQGIDVRYGLQPIQHEITDTDSLESIAAKYNTTVEVIKQSLHGETIKEILNRMAAVETARKASIHHIKIPDNKASVEERNAAQDKIDAINEKFDKERKKIILTIDNSQYKLIKNRMHQISNNMGGAYAKFDQPEMQRYLLFRMASFLRRYFTTMAMNRWGFAGSIKDPQPRLNPGLGDAQMGFYVEFIKTIGNIIQSKGSHIKYMKPSEKTATIKFFTEIGMLMIIQQLISLLGYDPDDKDRFNKLRKKSGPMGLLGVVPDQPGREFNALGFFETHTLHLLMQIGAENEQFNLLTGGFQQYNALLDLKSIAFGPTTDKLLQVSDNAKKLILGDQRAYYSRNMGPFEWQKKGDAKILNNIAKMFGISGSSTDPALAIQNFMAYYAIQR